MAEILKEYSYMALPSSIKRGNPAPLDVSEIWFSYEEMAAYAATNATAYVGQQMALVDEVNNTATAYIILNAAGDLQEIGAGVPADRKLGEHQKPHSRCFRLAMQMQQLG